MALQDAKTTQADVENGKPTSRPLYEQVGKEMEQALEHGLPQVEIRFRNLSVVANVQVNSTSEEDGQGVELPTLANDFKRKFARLTATKRHVRKQILNDVSGVFKPGTMTLVLGQPGSGKSTLMKLLSGRLPTAKNVQVDGEVSYNGKDHAAVLDRLPQVVSYVPQRDEHLNLLTVNETLDFANSFCPPGSVGDAAGGVDLKATTDLVEHFPSVMVQQLGLQNCQDTVIGDDMLRGVSGGERKRVTLGEMEFGLRSATFMDEISTGLDSATTFDVIKTQRSIADNLRKTIVIGLLQPAPEVFELFDDVMLLNDGEVMYYGPTTRAEQYFADLGYHRPPDRDVADFLLDIGTPQQAQYEVPTERVALQLPHLPNEFAELFRNSELHRHMLCSLDTDVQPALAESVNFDRVPKFRRSTATNAWVLARRQMMVTLRNSAYLKSRAFTITLMAIVFGFLFWKFNPSNAQVTLGVAYQASLFLVLSQGAMVTTHLSCRDVFYKQRRANFYQTAAYVMANSASLFPLAAIESVFFGTIVYWMCGFVAEAGAFFVFLLLLFLTNLAYAAWFFFLAAVSPNIHVLHPLSMISNLFYVVFAGFIIAKSQIPDWLIWIYWIDPLSWCFRALAVNQLRSSKLDVCEFNGFNYCDEYGMTMGEYSLTLYDIQSGREWIWYGVAFMVATYLFFMSLGFFVLEFKRYELSKSSSVRSPAVSRRDPENDNNYSAIETPKAVKAPDVVQVEVQHERPTIAPVVFAFQDIWYSVPKPGNARESLDLLKNVSGYALPGTMTALMGSSGAGKTTLIDVIAGRKTTGKIQGRILLNGHLADPLSVQRSTGYCEQMDVHSDASTIREALVFSAFLRQDSAVSTEHKLAVVEECLDMLDLRCIAGQMVRGCSAEQLKRLTIGVELAAQPSVLFLDEPTSGLDARTAKIVMDGVRRVADSGRTVLCTIHQPSAEIFSLFDALLLLKRGGETVFFGDLGSGSCNLVDYFESIDGISSLPSDYNPATWMLECIGAGVDKLTTDIDFVGLFGISTQKQALTMTLESEGIGRPSPRSTEITFGRKRAAGSMTQFVMLARRFFDLYWRTPSYNNTRFVISAGLALIFGVLYVDVDYDTYQGINAGLGVIFITSLFNGMIPFNSVLPLTSLQRGSYYRERASQTYSTFWFFVADSLVEVPYALVNSLLFTVIFFPMVDFSGFGTAVLYWLNNALLILSQVYFGQLFVYVLPNLEVAEIVGVLAVSILVLFMGFNPPGSAIPIGYQWLYHITPQKYSMGVFAALVFADCPDNDSSSLGCQPLLNAPTKYADLTVKEYVEQVFLTKHDELALNFGVQIAFIALFLVLKLLVLRFVNHQTR